MIWGAVSPPFVPHVGHPFVAVPTAVTELNTSARFTETFRIHNSRLHCVVSTFVVGPSRDRGKFPKTAQNGSSEVVIDQIYTTPSAPFDQRKRTYPRYSFPICASLTPPPPLSTPLFIDGPAFYLIINLSAGGTSGWFPDDVGNKPWYDTSSSKSPTPSHWLGTFF